MIENIHDQQHNRRHEYGDLGGTITISGSGKVRNGLRDSSSTFLRRSKLSA